MEELVKKPILTLEEARLIETIKAAEDAIGEFADDAVHEYRQKRAKFG